MLLSQASFKICSNLRKPAVDYAITPANTEYPWLEEETVRVPCQFTFTNLSTLKEANGREFLKLIDIAITDYETIRLSG